MKCDYCGSDAKLKASYSHKKELNLPDYFNELCLKCAHELEFNTLLRPRFKKYWNDLNNNR